MPLRRKILYALISSLAIIAGLECLLRVFDPLGVQAYYQWQAWVINTRMDHPTGYTLPQGQYVIAGYYVTIDSDGNRSLPIREDSTCTIAFIGDSVTFGIGVGDTDTFAWQIANMFHEVQFVNTAKGGYDNENIALSAEYIDADAYIYMIVLNDATSATIYYPIRMDNRIALRNHIDFFRRLQSEYVHLRDDYLNTLARIDASEVVYFGFEPSIPTSIASDVVDVVMMPELPRVSVADTHPNALGHDIITDEITPYISELIENNCN
jgi:hypothetical protein